jgi:hypothetical protein
MSHTSLIPEGICQFLAWARAISAVFQLCSPSPNLKDLGAVVFLRGGQRDEDGTALDSLENPSTAKQGEEQTKNPSRNATSPLVAVAA